MRPDGPFCSPHRCALATLLAAMSLLASCAWLQPISPEHRQATVAAMTRDYECVWYHKIDGDDAASSKLIKTAVQRGKAAGIEGAEIMSVYSQARAGQQQRVLEKALSMTEGQAPAVENIMDQSAPRQPSESDLNAALVALYRNQCGAR